MAGPIGQADLPDGAAAGPPLPGLLERFEPLLVELRRHDFPIGVDDYLRLGVVLSRMNAHLLVQDTPEKEQTAVLQTRYRRLLRPLFATTPDQQRRFDELFDEFWEGPSDDDVEPPEPEPEEEEKEKPKTEVPRPGIDSALTYLQKELAQQRAAAAEQAQKEKEEAAARLRRWLVGGAVALLALVFLSGFGVVWFSRARYDLEPRATSVVLNSPSAAPSGQPFSPASTTLRLVRKELGIKGLRHFLPGWWTGLDVRVKPSPASGTGAGLIKPERSRLGDAPNPEVTLIFQPAQAGTARASAYFTTPNPFDKVPDPVKLKAQAWTLRTTYQLRTAAGGVPKEITFLKTAAGFSSDGVHAAPVQVRLDSGGTGEGADLFLDDSSKQGVQADKLSLSGDADAFQFQTTPEPGTEPSRRWKVHLTFRPPQNREAQYEAQLSYRPGPDEAADPVSVTLRGNTPIPLVPQTAQVKLEANTSPQSVRVSRPLPLRDALIASLAAFLAGLLAWALTRRRKPDIGTSPTKPPSRPFEYPLFPESDTAPFAGMALGQTARILAPAERRDDAARRFDVEASIRATIRRAGFSVAVLRPHRQRPEYLALVEQQGPDDQLAGYFKALLYGLRAKGVPLRLFMYASDPLTCRGEDGAAYTLDQLKQRFPDRRVLVFGRAEALMARNGSRPGRAAWELDDWPTSDGRPVWSVFTPEDPDRLNRAGHVLRAAFPEERFGLFPATLEGVRRFGRRFVRSRGGRTEETSVADRETRPEPAPPAAPEVLGVAEHIRALREEYLKDDPRLFEWLCACTLYPRCGYDLTVLLGVHLGSVLTTTQPGPLVTERNLLRLLRIPWFRSGVISEELRLALQQKMDAEAAAAARERLVQLMAAPPHPPAGSLSRERLELERRVQAWLAEQKSPARAQMLRRLVQELPGYVLDAHPVLMPLLAQPKTDLWADVSPLRRSWMHFRYRHGIPRPEYRRQAPRWTIPALLVIAALLVFAGARTLPLRRVSVAGPPTLTLGKPTPSSFTFNEISQGPAPLAILTVTNNWPKPVRVKMSNGLANNEKSEDVAQGAKADIRLPLNMGAVLTHEPVTVTVSAPGEADPSRKPLEIPVVGRVVPIKIQPPSPLTYVVGGPPATAIASITGRLPARVGDYLSVVPDNAASAPNRDPAADAAAFSVKDLGDSGTQRRIQVTYAPKPRTPAGTVQRAYLNYRPSEETSPVLVPLEGRVRNSELVVQTPSLQYAPTGLRMNVRAKWRGLGKAPAGGQYQAFLSAGSQGNAASDLPLSVTATEDPRDPSAVRLTAVSSEPVPPGTAYLRLRFAPPSSSEIGTTEAIDKRVEIRPPDYVQVLRAGNWIIAGCKFQDINPGIGAAPASVRRWWRQVLVWSAGTRGLLHRLRVDFDSDTPGTEFTVDASQRYLLAQGTWDRDQHSPTQRFAQWWDIARGQKIAGISRYDDFYDRTPPTFRFNGTSVETIVDPAKIVIDQWNIQSGKDIPVPNKYVIRIRTLDKGVEVQGREIWYADHSARQWKKYPTKSPTIMRLPAGDFDLAAPRILGGQPVLDSAFEGAIRSVNLPKEAISGGDTRTVDLIVPADISSVKGPDQSSPRRSTVKPAAKPAPKQNAHAKKAHAKKAAKPAHKALESDAKKDYKK